MTRQVALTKAQFNAATALRNAKLIGANEGGASYKVGYDLLSMVDTGTGFEYAKFPGFFKPEPGDHSFCGCMGPRCRCA